MIDAIIAFSMIVLCVVLTVLANAVLITRLLRNQIDKYLDIKKRNVQVKEYELYMNFDIEDSKKKLIDFIDDHIANYVLYNFTTKDKDYINQEEAETLIKEVTKNVVLTMSDYYLFLVKINYNISFDNDLIMYVNSIVKERAMTYIASLNKPI